METFELRYFVAVARRESVHNAAKELSISPGSLSKAVARLEAELGVRLFQRVGRIIRLTDEGRLLLERATEILRLEESARSELQGSTAGIQVRIAAPEVLLAKVGVRLVRDILDHYPQARFVLTAASEAETERLARQHEVHLGLTTADVAAGLTVKRLFETSFNTVVGRGHPLFKLAKAGKPVKVADVLEFPFVCPDRPILGAIGKSQSVDGWRDDKFPRRVGFVADSLQMVEELVVSGTALAYLPDYFAQRMDAAVLTIPDCPFSCRQTVRLIFRDPEKIDWMSRVFS